MIIAKPAFVLLILIFALFWQGDTHLFASAETYPNEKVDIDNKLRQLAIEKGIIPEDADRSYLQKEMDEKNTVTMWILMSRENKITMIDGLKKKYKEEDIIINNPSADYVEAINIVLYDSILEGYTDANKKKGIKTIFETIATEFFSEFDLKLTV